MPIPTPSLPFEGYKWQWATLQCTEGINEPPVFLGVLRAALAFEGMPPSDPGFFLRLQETQSATNTKVKLARAPDRNLLRNSGQYWKGLGLLAPTSGVIALTQFGRSVAEGTITRDEFAATVVARLTLPNRVIQTNADQWDAAGLEIRPLRLILELVSELKKRRGLTFAYLSPWELYSIVIPLAGVPGMPLSTFADAIVQYRSGTLSLGSWPNCVPGANDRRMAREFLLFLGHYDFLVRTEDRSLGSDKHQYEKFSLQHLEPDELSEILGPSDGVPDLADIHRPTAESELLAGTVGRRRVLTSTLERPGQKKFRRQVLREFSGKCILTGNTMATVLEAAHVRPVEHHGNDHISNGVCLRLDIHRLFDAGHVKIHPDGSVQMSARVRGQTSYSDLPSEVRLPACVSRDLLAWRLNYL